MSKKKRDRFIWSDKKGIYISGRNILLLVVFFVIGFYIGINNKLTNIVKEVEFKDVVEIQFIEQEIDVEKLCENIYGKELKKRLDSYYEGYKRGIEK